MSAQASRPSVHSHRQPCAVQKTRAAQQESIPLLQIVAMKLLEGGIVSIWGNAVEITPTHRANAAIVVSLALKFGLAEGQRGEFRNRSRCKQCYRDSLIVCVAARDARAIPDNRI